MASLVLENIRDRHARQTVGHRFALLVSVFPIALSGDHLAYEGLSSLLPVACHPSLHQTFLLPSPLPSGLPSLQILSELSSAATEKLWAKILLLRELGDLVPWKYYYG